MRAFLAILSLLAVVSTAQAGPLPAPQVHPGRFVYTIPGHFDPPLIGRDGIEEIQAALSDLHYPYYVVLVDRIHGPTDEHAAQAIDGLVEDWQTQRGFDVAKSSIFLLAYGPERKYRFLAGGRWKSELGFEREAHRPYTRIFEEAVKGTPKDPKGGIIRMARAVDAFLFDQTDPVRIAERRAQAEREARERQQREARAALGEQIGRMERLLKKTDALPADVSAQKGALAHAREIWNTDDTVAMGNEATAFKPVVDELDRLVTAKERELFWQGFWNFVFWLTIVLIILGLVFWLVLRSRKLGRLRSELEKTLETWRTKIQRASARYVEFFGERDDIMLLHDQAKGETAALLKSVTDQVNSIFVDVQAMEQHITEIAGKAAAAHLFNHAPLIAALTDLDEPFDFDTGVLNPHDLFGAETKTVRVSPSGLERDLQKRFEKAMEGWGELKQAAELQSTIAEDHLTQDELDELFAQADRNGIPRRWLREHPLFGDDQADAVFYEQLNALRLTDPLKFKREISRFDALEEQIGERLDAFCNLLAQVREVKRDRFESLGVVIGSDDDPNLTLDQARTAEDELASVLHTSDTPDDVYLQIRRVHELYKKAIAQDAAIRSAIERLDGVIQSAEEVLETAQTDARTAQDTHEAAVKIHSKVESQSSITAGNEKIETGRRHLVRARELRSTSRLLDALRAAESAKVSFADATKQFSLAVKHCEGLDKKKAEFEKELKRMAAVREEAERKIRGYGGVTSRLETYSSPTINGVANYALLYAAIETQQRQWDDEVRSAKRAHEEREAARRRAEEEERRREAARRREEERRRSSYSSSSGSSWGGGGSSSSGGSWGGGGSSSSGGSW